MKYFVDRLEVVFLNLKIRYLTIALCCFDAIMTEQILDGYQFGIGIEQLGCHGMSQVVA